MKTTNPTTQFNHNPKMARLVVLAALTFITLVSAAAPGAAQEVKARPAKITLAKLAGTWTAGIELNGGCGIGSKQVTFTLNTSGTGPASYQYNTEECGASSGTGTMAITSLNADGSGTAVLSINFVGNFNIQVSPNGQVMGMVEIVDSGNYDVGVAVKQ
ncbi:MAG: hypothetical protein WBV46_17195 [Terriglobales bacterium]